MGKVLVFMVNMARKAIGDRAIAIKSPLVPSAFDKRELRYIEEVLHELGTKLEVIAVNGYVSPTFKQGRSRLLIYSSNPNKPDPRGPQN